ncbi:SPOR domain-containing protein [Novosphingobium sp.]|uniref:SPOR domain-containing protein n=1 Tax=Novosphingobium sp. TaxID=1874826 RepID=UPI0038B74E29
MMNGGQDNQWNAPLPPVESDVNAAGQWAADTSAHGFEGAAGHAQRAFEEAPGLALGDEERLPWLESAEDVDAEAAGPDHGRLIGLGVLSLVLLAAIVGGIYWLTHREPSPAASADGSLIEASREPYKVAPKDPGGKTFQGTGDSSFKVSEGEKPVAALAGSSAGPVATPAPAAKPSFAAAPAAPAASGGVGVQIGAFSSNAAAESAWTKLSAAHEPLKGLSHRVVEGKADMGTVYRLQAVSADAGAANSLCSALQAGGLKCQVKR